MPCPIRRFDEGCDRLWSLRCERGAQDILRQNEYLRAGGERQLFQQRFASFGHENTRYPQRSAHRLEEKIGPLNAGQAAFFAAGIREGAPQLLHAGILLTLYNTERHIGDSAESPCRFYAVLVRFDPRLCAVRLHHGWCCDSFRLCGFCNSGTEVDLLVRGNLARPSR